MVSWGRHKILVGENGQCSWFGLGVFTLYLREFWGRGTFQVVQGWGGIQRPFVVILGQLDAESIFGFSPTMLGVTRVTPRGTGAGWNRGIMLDL